MKYIAFLRAINVGGHTVKMNRLQELFAELGFENIRTYIQSGNVFFETGGSEVKLRKRIEAHLEKALGYAVPTVVRQVAEVRNLVALDPFKDYVLTEDTRHYVMFLAEPTSLPIPAFTEEFSIIGTYNNDLFLILTLRNGRPGNPTAYVEKAYGTLATSRFYHTLVKMMEI